MQRAAEAQAEKEVVDASNYKLELKSICNQQTDTISGKRFESTII